MEDVPQLDPHSLAATAIEMRNLHRHKSRRESVSHIVTIHLVLSKPLDAGRYIGRCPRCHFPVIAVSYPAELMMSTVVSFNGSPTFTVGENTPSTPTLSTVYPSSTPLSTRSTPDNLNTNVSRSFLCVCLMLLFRKSVGDEWKRTFRSECIDMRRLF